MRILPFLALGCAGALAAPAQSSALLDILADELNRNFSTLRDKAEIKPYYLAYAVTEEESQSVSASMGSLLNAGRGHNRFLDITMRIGEPKLDNYHRMRGDSPFFTPGSALALENNANAIRRRVWLDTDRVYRAAVARWIKIRTATQVKTQDEDDSDDFSPAPKVVSVAPQVRLKFDAKGWADRARKLSAEFQKYPRVLTSSLTVTAQRETKYFVNSEGTRLQHGRGFARVQVAARAKAQDGTDLFTTESMDAEDPDRLPGDEVILAAIRKVSKNVTNLLDAPAADPFVGPAILSGSAAGVFFHEIFGHRIEGHRQKDEAEGQTFTKSVGTKVLPDFLSVIFDPLRRAEGPVDLNGWYEYDDEGVKSRPVRVVEDGTLKTFLLSRSPIRGFPESNGHGRRQAGREIVSRQSNLIVESRQRVPMAKLREMLKEEVQRQNKPYGLFFEQVTGGFTTTGRSGLQAFTVIPLVVYRVFADGRPDELVRGVDIVGTPLSSFAKILATSDQPEVFNGFCGAESGSVPVSAVSPALLVSEIEIQRKDRSQDRPPLLPRPTGGAK